MSPGSGTRLNGGPGAVYELVGPAWESPGHSYLRARRLFQNFRYPASALDEAPADEALDVLIRRPLSGPSPAFERESVLTLPGMTWFLEGIDLIEAPPGDSSGPWLVVADPHAAPLPTTDLGDSVEFACEALGMLDALHRAGLAVGAMAPADFLRTSSGRWYFLGTDRIQPLESAEGSRSDLTHWARLTHELIAGGATEWPSSESFPARLREQARWLFERVRLCLDDDPANRPATVAELERGPLRNQGPLAALRSLFKGRRDPPSGPFHSRPGMPE